MTVIDCDAHVEEGVETWTYLDPAFYRKRPFPVQFPEDTVFNDHNAAWVIDYKIRLYGGTPTIMKRAGQKGAAIEVQELTDVEGRIAAMAEAGLDKQIIFPTLWQGPVAEDPELETALAQAWNTFMATQCGKSEGRLWFAAVIPYRRPDAAVAEIRRVKALGSVAGIYTHGIEWDMPLSNPGPSTKRPRARTSRSCCTRDSPLRRSATWLSTTLAPSRKGSRRTTPMAPD